MRKIYFGGDIITMENGEYADAVITNDGIIEDVGILEYLSGRGAYETELINLNGKTLMPAFIDSHSHILAVANSYLTVSLENIKNKDELRSKIKSYILNNKPAETEWIIASDFSDKTFTSKEKITLDFLDAIAADNPLLISNKSGHSGYFNSIAISQLLNNPQKASEYYFEENDYFKIIKQVPIPDINRIEEAFISAQKEYTSYGIATAQEGMITEEMIPIYKHLIKDKSLFIDIVGYAQIESADIITNRFFNYIKKYKNNFKLNGYKIFLDGSPQDKTAWMKTSYKNEQSNNFGFSSMSNIEVEGAVIKAITDKLQLLAHCNGDAAVEQFINSLKNVQSKGYDIKSIRPVIIHAQLIQAEQLEQLKELGIIVSFFSAHTYYFGDTHIENFGFERADVITPLNTALKNSITFTIHQDSPVIKPNMLESIQIAATRKTKSGVQLCEHEKVDVYELLKSITINAAIQYNEESTKGSLKKGKNADFVILSDNPLTVKVEDISKISVTETIKSGNTVYKKI